MPSCALTSPGTLTAHNPCGVKDLSNVSHRPLCVSVPPASDQPHKAVAQQSGHKRKRLTKVSHGHTTESFQASEQSSCPSQMAQQSNIRVSVLLENDNDSSAGSLFSGDETPDALLTGSSVRLPLMDNTNNVNTGLTFCYAASTNLFHVPGHLGRSRV